MQFQTVGEPWMLGVFFVVVIAMILVDIFMLGRKGDAKVSTKEALVWSIVWLTVAMLFNLWLYFYLGDKYGEEVASQKSLEFLTGYILEKSLAVDNLFVFVMLFAYFKVPEIYQKRVLLYGNFWCTDIAFYYDRCRCGFGEPISLDFVSIRRVFALFGD
jgi:tellurite resistance protein TerC